MNKFEYVTVDDVKEVTFRPDYDSRDDVDRVERRARNLEELVTAILNSMPSEQLLKVYVHMHGDDEHHDGYLRSTGVRFVARKDEP